MIKYLRPTFIYPSLFFVLFLIGASLWLLDFPTGFFDVDIANCFQAVLLGIWSPWFSYTYGAWIELAWKMTHSIFPVMYLQLGLFTLASLWLLWKIRDLPKRYSWLFLVFVFMSPMHVSQILAFLRDSTFSAMIPILLILLFDLNYHYDSKHVWWKMAITALVGGIASSIRFDALFIIPGIIIILFWKFELPIKKKLFFTVLLLIFTGAFNLGLKASPKAYQGTKDYQLTSFVHPLSVAAHDGRLTPEQESAIDAIISVDALRKLFDPVQIRPYHESGPKAFNDEQWNNLIHQLPDIFWNNLGVILFSRYEMMLGNFGLKYFLYTRLSGSVGDDKRAAENLKTMGLENPPTQGLFKSYYLRTEGWAYSEPLIKSIFYGALPFFFLCFLILRTFRKNPIAAYLLVLCWIRLPVIFLLAPGAHMKYVYPFYIGTLFCFFLAKVEGSYIRLKSERKREMVA